MVFDAVASLESVSAAARKLSMTQSAVSMSLGQLEKYPRQPVIHSPRQSTYVKPLGQLATP